MALIHMNYHSDTLGMPAELDIILPESAATQIGMGGKRDKIFSTLYLLHGLSDDHTIWQRRTSIERYASRYGIAVVMPNAHRSWYADMKEGGKYFTFISEELPRVCRAFFKGMSDEREYNYIAGLSMGGYGALKTAMAKPESFAGVASFSGAMEVDKYMRDGAYVEPSIWRAIFGDAESVLGSVNDVYAAAERCIKDGREMPKLYLSCGTEDNLLGATRRMHSLLDEGNVEHVYREAPGEHNWGFWDSEIQLALEYFFGKNDSRLAISP